MSGSRRWTIAALALSGLYAAVLAETAPAMGYTRDEGYYFKAAEQYAVWWDTLFSRRFTAAFGDDEIRLRFGYNTEHPALVKLTQGITFRVLNKDLEITGPAQAFRATGFLFAAFTVLATFLLGRALISAPVGFMAAVLLTTLPRFFYDAHLACFDVPMTAMWTLALWSFWRALEAPFGRALRPALLCGLMFGLALATKLNAMFLPPIFVLVWLHRVGRRSLVAFAPGPSGGLDLRLPPIPMALIACAILGPAVFIAHWPYLWHETFTRIGAYVSFHLHHEHYPIRYFGQVLVQPPFPWHFPWVMTALTVPISVLALGVAGVGISALRRSSADLLLVLSVFVPIALISVPGTPIFGGVKHWYTAMPALCILAARGVADGAQAIARSRPSWRHAAAPALLVITALPGIMGIARSHPNGVSYYNEVAGGFRGGATLGMQRSFWGGLSRPLLPDVARLRPGTRVFFDHTNYDAYLMYVREGSIPAALSFANKPEEGAAATLFEDREGAPLSEEAAWSKVGVCPASGVYADEVTLVQLFAGPCP